MNNKSVLARIFSRYIPRWPYFALSIIVSFGISIVYLKLVQPLYDIKASLIIMDKNKVDQDKTALNEIDIANTSKKVEIEIEVLKSRPLIRKVLNDINGWSTYQEIGDKSPEILYSKTPIIFQPIDKLPESKGNFLVKIINSENIEIKYLNKTVKTSFNKGFKSPIGNAIIKSTPYLADYIGLTIRVGFDDTDVILSQYQNSLEATLVDKLAPIIELNFHDTNVERGKDFLNYLVTEYNLSNSIEKQKLTESTLAFIDERLGLLTGELTTVEKDIEGYKSSRGITDISSESNIYLQNIQSNDSQLNNVNTQLQVIQGIENAINKNSIPATIGIEDKGLITLIDQLSRLQLEKNKLLATTPETNFLFEPIKKQIQTTTLAIKENVNNIKLSLLNIKNSLQRVNSRVESSIKSLPGQERGYISIKRQQGIKENLYTYLLQKREEVALSYASTLTNASIIDKAYLSSVIWPKKSFIFAFVLIISILLTASIIYLKELFTTKISSSDEASDSLIKPIILSIPNVKNLSKSLISISETKHIYIEPFRNLRSSINHIHSNKKSGRITLFSSLNPGEGKSFLATNLSMLFAATGRKTVILDLNLRQQQIANNFELSLKSPGVSEFLLDKANLNNIIQQSIEPNLFVITSGQPTHTPSELIESNKLITLLKDLKNIFDDIIIDSPAINSFMDLYAFSGEVDATIIIIRKGITKKTDIHLINNLIEEIRLPKIALVFNGGI